MRVRVAFPCVLFSLVLLSGCITSNGPVDDEAPVPQPDAKVLTFFDQVAASPELRFETDHGTIRMLLYTELMPQTAGRIGELAEDGFYEDTLIHRVVDDFVIQGGDPSGTGEGGSGQTIPHEIHPELRYGGGAVGLARLDEGSGDSQWFITDLPAPHLDDPSRSMLGDLVGAYALFGQVFDGMPVVRSIAAVPVIPGLDRPIEDVYLQEATVHPAPETDLLQYPRTIRTEDDAADRYILERPLHLFANHTITLTVYWNPENGETPPSEIPVRYGQAGAPPIERQLRPLADDPWVFTGNVTLPVPGLWQERVGGREGMPAVPLDVHSWHADYGAYVRG